LTSADIKNSNNIIAKIYNYNSKTEIKVHIEYERENNVEFENNDEFKIRFTVRSECETSLFEFKIIWILSPDDQIKMEMRKIFNFNVVITNIVIPFDVEDLGSFFTLKCEEKMIKTKNHYFAPNVIRALISNLKAQSSV
jgi:hypothetical protein